MSTLTALGGYSLSGGRPCLLRVYGLQASGLRPTDRNGLADPFITMRVGAETFKSRVIHGTLNPVWDKPTDAAIFGASAKGASFSREDTLYVDVWDSDAFRDTPLGSTAIFIADLFPTTPPIATAGGTPPTRGKANTYTLYLQGAVAGEVFLIMEAMGYRPPPEGASDALVMPQPGGGASAEGGALGGVVVVPNCLKLTVHGARNLIERNGKGRGCNAFARVIVGDCKTQSATRQNEANPAWGEGWAFPVVERGTQITVRIEHVRILGPSQFNGTVSFRLSDFDASRGSSVRQWFKLNGHDNNVDKERGDVEIELHWLYLPHFATADATLSSSAEILRLDAAGAPVIPVAAKSARGATAADPATIDGASGEVEEKVEAAAGADTNQAASAVSRIATLQELDIKDGDWQVQLHIIEARQLKGENFDGTSDPVVYVEIGGQKQHTRIMKSTTSCVFDHHMFFALPRLARADVEALSVQVSVYDANVIASNTLIGRYTFDAMEIYYQQDHQFYKRWIGLVDPTSKHDKGLQGYLRLSVVVLGPGDKLVVPEENSVASRALEADASAAGDKKPGKSLFGRSKKAALADADGELMDAMDETDAASLVLMPPSVSRRVRWLVIGAIAADGLPAMDDGVLGSSPGIDAFLEVRFAGNPPCRTRWITRKGHGHLAVEWMQELWIPFLEPCLSSRIEVSVWDYDRLTANDRVGTVLLNFRDVQAGALPPSWHPVYGAPDDVTFGAYKNRMNKLPTVASNYRGRVLLSARIEDPAKGKNKDKDIEREVPHARKMLRPPKDLLPLMAVFRIRALVIAGDELPTFTGNVAARLGLLNCELGVAIGIGDKILYTPRVKVKRGQARWCSLLEGEVVLPTSSHSALPDTFIYLYRGDPSKERVLRVCYARLPTPALIARGLRGAIPYWQPLREDMAVNALGDNECSGSILLRLGIGSPAEARDVDWHSDLRDLDRLTPYELRVHVYQGRNLPPADDNGSLDPYLRISINGETRRTAIRYATTSPTWYETISMDVLLPVLRFAPQLHVELWDSDDITSDDFVSELRYNLNSPSTLLCSYMNLPRELPHAPWFRLSRLESASTNAGTDASVEHGEVMMQIQLIAKDTAARLVPWIPDTIAPEPALGPRYFLEIIALGVRDLPSFELSPIQAPHVEFDASSRSSRATAMDALDFARTAKSKYPSGADANFCERLLIPVSLPQDAYYAACVNASVHDNRLGGFNKRCVGTFIIPLQDRIPWSETYRPPRGGIRAADLNPFSDKGVGAAARQSSFGTTLPPWATLDGPHPYALTVTTQAKSSTGPRRLQKRPAIEAAVSGGRTINVEVPANVDATAFAEAMASLLATGMPLQDAVAGAARLLNVDTPGAGDDSAGTDAARHSEHDLQSPLSPSSKHVAVAVGAEGVRTGASSTGPVRRLNGVADGLGSPAAPSEPRLPIAHDAAAAPPTGPRRTRTGPDSRSSVVAPAAPGLQSGGAPGAPVESGQPATLEDYAAEQRSFQPVTGPVPLLGAAARAAVAQAPDALASPTSPASEPPVSPEVPRRTTFYIPSAEDHPAAQPKESAEAGSTGGGGLIDKLGTRPPIAPEISTGKLAGASASVNEIVARSSGVTQTDTATIAGPALTRAEQCASELGIDLSKHLAKLNAAEGNDDDAQIAYLLGRREYSAALEDVFGTAPFERFDIQRGQRVGRGILGDNSRTAGVFKGIVRLISDAREPPPIDMQLLLNPKTYVVRVYVLNAHSVQPKDASGTSDPYLIVKLGNTTINRRSAFKTATTEPEFFEMFEVRTTLPGPSQLTVEMWDYDLLTSDDLIGTTTIDLEDRLFEPTWRALGEEAETTTRLRPKPIEARNLWAPTATSSQGVLRMWVDILTPEEAVRYPAVNITPPPPKRYQVRAIVWKTRGMAASDAMSDMNDLYLKAWVEGEEKQSTDVHWRSKRGVGSFNWRMLWDVSLPRKFFYFRIQAWDKDIVKYSDCIGEASLDLTPHIRRALRNPTRGIQLLQSDSAELRKRKARPVSTAPKPKQNAAGAATSPSGPVMTGAGAEVVAAAMAHGGVKSVYFGAPTPGAGGVARGVSAADGGASAATGQTGAAKDGSAPTDAVAVDIKSLTQAGAPEAADETNHHHDAGDPWSLAGRVSSSLGMLGSVVATGHTGDSSTEAGANKLVGSLTSGNPLAMALGMRDAAAQADTKMAVSALKKAAGLETDVHPEHAQWVKMYRTEYTTGQLKQKLVGEVLLTIELLPEAIAKKYPAGRGRSAPNQHPTLPAPIGRVRCSANPCYLMSECCGPRLFACGVCCIMCMLLAVIGVFGAPFLNTLIQWLSLLPKQAAIAIWVLLAICCCAPPCYCYFRFVCCPPSMSYDEADLSGSASDTVPLLSDGVSSAADEATPESELLNSAPPAPLPSGIDVAVDSADNLSIRVAGDGLKSRSAARGSGDTRAAYSNVGASGTANGGPRNDTTPAAALASTLPRARWSRNPLAASATPLSPPALTASAQESGAPVGGATSATMTATVGAAGKRKGE